jgi:6-pyruvoyltetrahydropterin/6-carboxytetrahydropterin synthase
MVYITRRVTFSAAHRLFNPTLSDEENEEIYDKCNNINYHGHNYHLEVTVKGIPDPKTGYLIDLKKLKRIINEHVFQHVDHKNLNIDVPFLEGVITSVENLIAIFWDILKDKLLGCELHRIKIWETENNMVEYYGESFDIPRYN